MRSLVFPPDDGALDPSWWAPLEAVGQVIASEPRYRFFDLADFMVMARVVRRNPRPDILLYKHGFTRRYLNLDEGGHAYRYRAPRELHRGSGRYLRHRALSDALDDLDLWELPWMKSSLEEHRHGLSWEEHWQLHPDLADIDDDFEEPGDGHLHVV